MSIVQQAKIIAVLVISFLFSTNTFSKEWLKSETAVLPEIRIVSYQLKRSMSSEAVNGEAFVSYRKGQTTRKSSNRNSPIIIDNLLCNLNVDDYARTWNITHCPDGSSGSGRFTGLDSQGNVRGQGTFKRQAISFTYRKCFFTASCKQKRNELLAGRLYAHQPAPAPKDRSNIQQSPRSISQPRPYKYVSLNYLCSPSVLTGDKAEAARIELSLRGKQCSTSPNVAQAERQPDLALDRRSSNNGGQLYLSEEDAYSAAFDQIRLRNFESALRRMTQFKHNFPNSKRRPDAIFWAGQVYDVLGQSSAAIGEFIQLFTEYPNYRRLSAATVKLGKLLIQENRPADGRLLLSQVIASDAGSSAANEAVKVLQKAQLSERSSPSTSEMQSVFARLSQIYGQPTSSIISNVQPSPQTMPIAKPQLRSQVTTSTDTMGPKVQIIEQRWDGKTLILTTRIHDESGVAAANLNGLDPTEKVSDEIFVFRRYIGPTGLTAAITAVDVLGQETVKTVQVDPPEIEVTENIAQPINPTLGPKSSVDPNRVAFIIGVERYESIPSAKYARNDALMFKEFAEEKLGVSSRNILVLTGEDANQLSIYRALERQLPALVREDVTELFVFFSGHGVPSNEGTPYLMPFDGDTGFLRRSAVTRKEFFTSIKSLQAKHTFLFFDNCFSGTTRDEQFLLAANNRALGIKILDDIVPENFTVLSATSERETATAHGQIQHGLFSYYLFKGLEGAADENDDRRVSANELGWYVQDRVKRDSFGAQTPQLTGAGERLLIR